MKSIQVAAAILSSLVFSVGVFARTPDPTPAPTPPPTPSPTPAPHRSIAFEALVGTDPFIYFYRSESFHEINLAYKEKSTGFTLKSSSSITPGGWTRFPPTSVFEMSRETGEKNLIRESSLCWPDKLSKENNLYFKALSCNDKKGVCTVEFSKNYGEAIKKSVPFFQSKDGSFQIASKHLALALIDKIPNKTSEFKDLLSEELRYGRIAVSALTCKPTSERNVMTCSWSTERDQNPFPEDQPWDDCQALPPNRF